MSNSIRNPPNKHIRIIHTAVRTKPETHPASCFNMDLGDKLGISCIPIYPIHVFHKLSIASKIFSWR